MKIYLKKKKILIKKLQIAKLSRLSFLPITWLAHVTLGRYRGKSFDIRY